MSGLKAYLDELRAGLGSDILDEIADHLSDRMEAWCKGGCDMDESERRTVEAMGPPERVAKALRNVHGRGTWQEAILAGLPHLLFAICAGLPPLAQALVGSPHSLGFEPLFWLAALVIATLLFAGRRGWPRWSASWIGYGMLFGAFALFPNSALNYPYAGRGFLPGMVVVLALLVTIQLWTAKYDRMAAVLSSQALAPMLWCWGLARMTGPSVELVLVLALGLLAGTVAAVSVRQGSFSLAAGLGLGVNALAGIATTSIATFHSSSFSSVSAYPWFVLPWLVTLTLGYLAISVPRSVLCRVGADVVK
jgi:hypothetical protein